MPENPYQPPKEVGTRRPIPRYWWRLLEIAVVVSLLAVLIAWVLLDPALNSD